MTSTLEVSCCSSITSVYAAFIVIRARMVGRALEDTKKPGSCEISIEYSASTRKNWVF